MAMDDIEFKALVEGQLNSSVGYIGDAIVSEQTAALDAYYGQPYGDEQQGRSQMIDRTVMDTVEQAMPSLMRIFTASKNLVTFNAQMPDPDLYPDPMQYNQIVQQRSEMAQQATDYVNHVFFHEASSNGGFGVLYDWFKDALIQKVGVCQMWWDVRKEVKFQTFEKLTEDEYAALLEQFPDAEVVEETKDVEKLEATIETPGDITDIDIEEERVSYDIKLKFMREKKGIRVDVVPPEEFLISRHSRAIDDPETTMVGRRTLRTRSELISMGFDASVINNLPSGHYYSFMDDTDRGRFPDETFGLSSDETEQNANVEVFDLYVRADFDEDNIAEIRHVFMAGGEILVNDEVDRIPFYEVCPIPIPHRFFGLGLADITVDLQRLKTTLWRQVLDNLYFTNTPEVVAGPGVRTQDLARRVIGGVIRADDVNQIRWNSVPFTAGQSFPMMDYVDNQRKQRTGTAADVAAMNPEALKRITAEGVREITTQAQSRLELIARIFAETGVKRLFRDMLKMMVEHQDFKKVIQIRGNLVPIDPSRWPSDMDVTCEIGLGHGTEMEKRAAIQQVLQLQERLAQAGPDAQGMVMPDNIYNSLQRLIPLTGLSDITPYFNKPTPPDPNQQPEPTQAEIIMQLEQQKSENEFRLKQQEMDLRQRNNVAELELKRQEMGFKMELERQINNEKIRLMQADAAIADEDRAVTRDIKLAEFAMKNAEGPTTESDLSKRLTEMEQAIDELKKEVKPKEEETQDE